MSRVHAVRLGDLDYLDWRFEDPKGRPLQEGRATRDDIARRVERLIAELDTAGDP